MGRGDLIPVWRVGDRRFRAANIYCVGWNYWEHNREMGRESVVPPVFFQKSLGTVARPLGREAGSLCTTFRIPHPDPSHQLSYEGELVILIGKAGSRIRAENAAEHIAGYAAGLDLTLRDVQHKIRSAGQPWFPAKNFPNATVVGCFVHKPLSEILSATLRLKVNGEVRQNAPLSGMLNPPEQIIALLSSRVTLFPGDLIFTGTPSGTGSLAHGDTVDLEIERLPALRLMVI